MSVTLPTAAMTPATPVPVIEETKSPGFGATDLLLLLMAALWGGNFFALQYGASSVPPLAFNAARMIVGAIALSLVILFTVKEPWPSRADTLRLLGCGVVGNGVYQVLFMLGLARARSGSASLILAASPAVLAVLGWALGTEKVTRFLGLGIALSMSGVLLVLLGDNVAASRNGSWVGSALLSAAVVAWAAYVTMLRPLTQRVSGAQLSLITLIGGLVPLCVIASRDLIATDWMALTLRTWAAMFYSGVGAIVLAYLIYYHGLKKIGPTRTSMYANLQPFVAILIAWQLQNDRPTLWQIMGFLCITGGLLLARRRA
jgi:drug/metabolite transporter (DMT)-like permease